MGKLSLVLANIKYSNMKTTNRLHYYIIILWPKKLCGLNGDTFIKH